MAAACTAEGLPRGSTLKARNRLVPGCNVTRADQLVHCEEVLAAVKGPPLSCQSTLATPNFPEAVPCKVRAGEVTLDRNGLRVKVGGGTASTATELVTEP